MKWQEVRQHFPNQWLLVQAMETRSEGGYCYWERVMVLEKFSNGSEALKGLNAYLKSHAPHDVFIFHTAREQLKLEEKPRVVRRITPRVRA
jgi:hypothetical protein